MAGRNPGEHGPRQRGLPMYGASRRDHGQRSGGGDGKCVHRFADDVFAQHRADGGQPVSTPRERCASRALEVKVATVGELAEQEGATIAKTWDEAAELMPGVALRDGD